MKQVLRKGLKEIVVEDVPDPVLQAHHVLIRPSFSLISSGTEAASLHQEGVLSELRHNPSHLHKIAAAMKTNGPQRTIAEVRAKFSEYAVLGYSGAGRVAAVARHVTDIEPGQMVAFGGEGSGHGETVVAGRNLVVPVPQGMPLEHATFATLGSIAMQAVRIAAIGLGETVVVIGLGIVGQLVSQLARLQGGRVIGVDLRPERMELATRLGAEHVLAADAAGEIRGLTGGRGADCVVVAAAAKSAAAVHSGTGNVCRPGPHYHRRRSADRISVARHVHEGSQGLHVTRVWAGKLRCRIRETGPGLPDFVRAMD